MSNISYDEAIAILHYCVKQTLSPGGEREAALRGVSYEVNENVGSALGDAVGRFEKMLQSHKLGNNSE